MKRKDKKQDTEDSLKRNDELEFLKKMRSLPFTAHVKGKGKSSIKIINAEFIDFDGNKTTIVDKPVELTTDGARDNSESGGSATLSIPVTDPSQGKVNTSGTGRVISLEENQAVFNVVLNDGKKEMEADNSTTHFAKLRTKLQGDEEIQYLDILFGEKDKVYKKDERPHICIKLDGSGHFIRWGNDDGILECRDANYENESGVVVPRKTFIRDKKTGKQVEILFKADVSSKTILVEKFSFIN